MLEGTAINHMSLNKVFSYLDITQLSWISNQRYIYQAYGSYWVQKPSLGIEECRQCGQW